MAKSGQLKHMREGQFWLTEFPYLSNTLRIHDMPLRQGFKLTFTYCAVGKGWTDYCLKL